MSDAYDSAPEGDSAEAPPVEETFAASESAGGEACLPEGDLATLTAERDEYLDSLRRLQADFDNFRKRSVRQQTELLERATEGLLVQLLPVLDALDLAETHASEDEKTALSQVGTLLRDTLARQGLERIDAVGVEFDPTVHDAVAHEEAEGESGEKPNEIAEVMRAGYRLKGRVVRPAMVKVLG